MIGTEVIFDTMVLNGGTKWERKVGIIRDKIRRSHDHSPQVIDFYVIESDEKYYFVICDKIIFKTSK